MAEQETAERDLTVYVTKAPTDQQTHFATWITEQTGYNPDAAKSKREAFFHGVRLAKALVMVHQSSDEWREAREILLEEKAAAKAAAEAEAAAAPPKPAKAAKAAKKAAAPAVTPGADAPPAKATPAKKATTRRRAAAAPAADADVVPF